jgi:hypothetical protein
MAVFLSEWATPPFEWNQLTELNDACALPVIYSLRLFNFAKHLLFIPPYFFTYIFKNTLCILENYVTSCTFGGYLFYVIFKPFFFSRNVKHVVYEQHASLFLFNTEISCQPEKRHVVRLRLLDPWNFENLEVKGTTVTDKSHRSPTRLFIPSLHKNHIITWSG